MKYDKFFELAKLAGIEEAELYVGESYSLNFSLFHSEVDSYSSNKSMTILARGIVNGKFGTANCDSWSAQRAKYLVDEIVANVFSASRTFNEKASTAFCMLPKCESVIPLNAVAMHPVSRISRITFSILESNAAY